MENSLGVVQLYNFDHYKRMDVIKSQESAKVILADSTSKTVIAEHSKLEFTNKFVNKFIEALESDAKLFYVQSVVQELLIDERNAALEAQQQEEQEPDLQEQLKALPDDDEIKVVDNKGGDKDE